MKTREAIDLYKAYTSVKFTGVPGGPPRDAPQHAPAAPHIGGV